MGPLLVRVHIGVVEGRSDRVLLRPTGIGGLPPASVHVQVDLLRRDGGRFGLELIDLGSVLGGVLVTFSVDIALVPHELQAVEVGARTRIRQVRRWFVAAGAGGRGTESRYLGAE